MERFLVYGIFLALFIVVCLSSQGFAAETSANATVLTITAFTVERYVAICHPFQAHAVSKLSRAVKLVLAIWVLALCLAVPQAMSFGVVVEVCLFYTSLFISLRHYMHIQIELTNVQ